MEILKIIVGLNGKSDFELPHRLRIGPNVILG